MRAILVREFGGPEVLQIGEVADPVADKGEVRVRVHAIGVNPFDAYMRTGNYARKPPLPYVPGADAAGIIDQVGDGVNDWRVGDRVYIGGTIYDRSWGAYAELAPCLPEQVHLLPSNVTFAQGAAINVPYVTAWRALFGRARASAGESVFVHGASGGVGIAVTQMARAAGLTVIGSAGSPDGIALVRAEGAHHVLNHREPAYLDRLPSLTAGRGPDIIIEMLANVNLDADLGAIAPQGRIVIVGNRGRIEIDARKAMARDASVFGTTFWNIGPDELARIHQGIGAGLEAGTLRPAIGEELPLEQAPVAHARILEGTHRGKYVLVT
jgi:NADPH2:quinone reductase